MDPSFGFAPDWGPPQEPFKGALSARRSRGPAVDVITNSRSGRRSPSGELLDQDELDRLSRAVRERLRRRPVGARIDAQAMLQDLMALFPAVPMDEIWSVIQRQCKALGLNYRH